MIAKSISIKGQGAKFGRRALKAAALTSGERPGRLPDSGLGGARGGVGRVSRTCLTTS